MRARRVQALWGIVAVAAVVRFATLDQQSLGTDEAVTVGLLRLDLLEMLERIPESESTPPLYYVAGWLWAKVFGTGEIGVRSLSALCGTAFVPVLYAVGVRAAGVRVGFVAAALAALNPLLVWYSQEARAYALVTLLAALSLLFFVRLLNGDASRRTVALWAGVSALALATHYFALFVVAMEGAWLLARVDDRRALAAALGALAAVQAALMPLLLHQRSLGLADFSDEIAPAARLVRAPKQFLVGFDAPGEVAGAIVAAALVLLALWLAWNRGDARERGAAVVGLALGGAVVVATAVPALLGFDYFTTRNVLIAWAPLALAVAAGFGARRSGRVGLAAAAALALVGAWTTLAVVIRPGLQREDWRGAATALEPAAAEPRAVVTTPFTAVAPFEVYAPGLVPMGPGGAVVREIDLVALPIRERTQLNPTGLPPRPHEHPPPAAGFHLVETRFERTFTLLRFTAPRPVRVWPAGLVDRHLAPEQPAAVFVER